MRSLISGFFTALATAYCGGVTDARVFRKDHSSNNATVANNSVIVNPSLIVDLGYVRYQGVQKAPQDGGILDEPVKSWYGVRYAASPEGPRRWAAPVNIESANNFTKGQVVDATQPGPSCLNGFPAWVTTGNSSAGLPFIPPPNGTSEDCLLLNVHKPVFATNATKLPVIVQIHGGGYIDGSAETALGELLVSRSKSSIVYIEIQYRLGGLGFLSGSVIKANGTANAGYADQRSALEWVQRNIAVFGGDPSKVTILGGSAGAGSVAAQMQLFGGAANPPFRAAIAEYPGILFHHEDAFLDQQYRILLQTAGCTTLTCLRSLSFDGISAAINRSYAIAYQQGVYGFDDNYYQPSVDGNLIRELPSVAFKNGRFTKVPFISNHNALEGIPFANASVASDADIHAFLQKLLPPATPAFLSQVDQLYPASDFNGSYFDGPVLRDLNALSPRGELIRALVPGLGRNYDARNAYYFKAAQIFGDLVIACPSQWLAAGVANASAPAWKLNYNSGIYVHGAVDVTALDPQPLVSDADETAALMAYFIGFATELDPNRGPLATRRQFWPQYGSVGTVLEINQPSIFNGTNHFVTKVDPDLAARCQFWLNADQITKN